MGGESSNMFKYLWKIDPKRAVNLELVKKWISGWTLKRKVEMTEDDLKTTQDREE